MRSLVVRFFIILLFTILPFAATAQYRLLLHKSYPERYVALDSIFYANRVMRLDSATMFRELDKLEKLARKNNDEELELEARLIRYIYDMVGPQQNHRRSEAGLIALRQEADEKEIKHLQVRTREKLAYFYFYIAHKYGHAFENYLAYFALLKHLPVEDFPEKQELIAHIGSAYFNFGDVQNARKYFAIAQQVPSSYKKRFPINLQNTLGLIYRSENKHKLARHYFRKAYHMAEANKDSTWMGIAAGNIGISYFQQKRFNEAMPLLKLDVRQSMLAHEMDNALGSLVVMMKIEVARGNWKNVGEDLKLAEKLLPLTGNTQMHLRELYLLQARYSAATGNFERAYHLADSASVIRDTLYNRKSNVFLNRIEQNAEIEEHQDRLQALEANAKFRSLLLYSLAIGLVLLFIIAALVVNRQRLVFRERQQLLRAEKENIEQQLQQAANKLHDFTTRIREKNKLIEEFTTEIKKLQVSAGQREVTEKQEALTRLQQSTILTEEQWDEFREIFETVHNGYLQRLRLKVPGLSPAETRFMVLNKLSLSSKEMAAMLGVSAEAIRQTRHRLRKKLETTVKLDLDELSSTI